MGFSQPTPKTIAIRDARTAQNGAHSSTYGPKQPSEDCSAEARGKLNFVALGLPAPKFQFLGGRAALTKVYGRCHRTTQFPGQGAVRHQNWALICKSKVLTQCQHESQAQRKPCFTTPSPAPLPKCATTKHKAYIGGKCRFGSGSEKCCATSTTKQIEERGVIRAQAFSKRICSVL